MGLSGNVTIGLSYRKTDYFKGHMDQMSFEARAKSADEILDDATLVAFYKFENDVQDSGPLLINGTSVGTGYSSGRIGNALAFPSTATDAYFQASGFILLGTPDYPYSISLWINPTKVKGGATIVHASTSQGWCMAFMGFSALGEIVVQSWSGQMYSLVGPNITGGWTHVASTYSHENGLSLYVNGEFIDTTVPFLYQAENIPKRLTLGKSPASTGGHACEQGKIVTGQYNGALDEFRLYSRELTAGDVYLLANP